MCRSIDLKLEPAAHHQAQGRLSVFAYKRGEINRSLTETVYFNIESPMGYASVDLTPDEARVLANQLLQVADQADEQRALNESLDEIEDQLRDPDFDTRLVRFCHPDVVYAPHGQMAETAATHPGKLVIEEQAETDLQEAA